MNSRGYLVDVLPAGTLCANGGKLDLIIRDRDIQGNFQHGVTNINSEIIGDSVLPIVAGQPE